MKKRQLLLIYTCISLLLSCESSLPTDPNYPTVIEEISTIEQQTMVDQISQTPLSGNISVDQFGFPFISANIDSLIENNDWELNATRMELEAMMKETVAAYSSFMKCNDTSLVKAIRYSTPKDGIRYLTFFENYADSIPPLWMVSTNNQTYDGIEVLGTSLKTLISPEGAIGITGQWYDAIYIPPTDMVNEDSIKVILADQTFKYRSSSITFSEETTWLSTKKVVFPLRYASEIELRVCWALHPESWEFLVDTQTGEVLSWVDLEKL